MRRVKIFFKYLLAVAFVFAGINHFVTPDFYIGIMPPYIPAPAAMVYLSGATEIIAGVMLAIPATAQWGAWFIVAHLVVFTTVHVHMAVNADQFPDAPPAMLYARIALQFVLIAWAWWFTRPGHPEIIDHTRPAGAEPPA